MSNMQATVMAYTYMGRIHVGTSVHEFAPSGEANPVLLQQSTNVADDGEDDPREFLKGILIALLETL